MLKLQPDSMIYIEAFVKMPYRPEQEANYKSHMRTSICKHAPTHTHTRHKHTQLKKGEKMINKTTMIERAKQKWDLQLSTSFLESVK